MNFSRIDIVYIVGRLNVLMRIIEMYLENLWNNCEVLCIMSLNIIDSSWFNRSYESKIHKWLFVYI